MLRSRPGELVRRLDHALRASSNPEPMLAALAVAAPSVATPVLLQALVHFENRSQFSATPPPVRAIFPKGNTAKMQVLRNRLPRLDAAVVATVVRTLEQAVLTRFAALPSLGKVYVDPAMRRYMVPFSQRSASKSLRTIVRGSRVPFAADATLRFFLWWKEGPTCSEPANAGERGLANNVPTGRVDIDLTAAMYGANYQLVSMVSWTTLRDPKSGGCHSGDITSAPNGACEFIDLDLATVRRNKIRYIVANVYAFTAHPFCNLPECFMGWMRRKSPNSGEIFEPATVVDRLDLASNSRVCIPAIFDVDAGEMIWADAAFAGSPNFANTIESNQASVGKLLQGLVEMRKPSLHHLFSLHATARGHLVDSAANADAVFSVAAGVTPFQMETILADYLK